MSSPDSNASVAVEPREVGRCICPCGSVSILYEGASEDDRRWHNEFAIEHEGCTAGAGQQRIEASDTTITMSAPVEGWQLIHTPDDHDGPVKLVSDNIRITLSLEDAFALGKELISFAADVEDHDAMVTAGGAR
ncbi:hypothetical protein [Mycobacteroides abscessus]|uniref:hypothetical protein n=1 Tax=Mycobacteroides abscessus TaxID=36809 RepID=UPI0005DEF2CA|nr:hypothetical protein [Mycobacteroides abscessus]CPR79550.1 Uncharacterised protein [Mycobacteroides abscessus]CPR88667.1 Uncharacterised protein [Mycobacteroides abscessus]CPS43610.1 Uncharacterised protein [Mycobacteroides abscessus]CPV03406.1 Uncharacterised protein [Mycobacteroides abscessus]